MKGIGRIFNMMGKYKSRWSRMVRERTWSRWGHPISLPVGTTTYRGAACSPMTWPSSSSVSASLVHFAPTTPTSSLFLHDTNIASSF